MDDKTMHIALRCVMRSEHVSGRKFLSYVDRIMYGDSNAAMVCCKSIKFERYGRRSRHWRGRHLFAAFCLGFLRRLC